MALRTHKQVFLDMIEQSRTPSVLYPNIPTRFKVGRKPWMTHIFQKIAWNPGWTTEKAEAPSSNRTLPQIFLLPPYVPSPVFFVFQATRGHMDYLPILTGGSWLVGYIAELLHCMTNSFLFSKFVFELQFRFQKYSPGQGSLHVSSATFLSLDSFECFFHPDLVCQEILKCRVYNGKSYSSAISRLYSCVSGTKYVLEIFETLFT